MGLVVQPCLVFPMATVGNHQGYGHTQQERNQEIPANTGVVHLLKRQPPGTFLCPPEGGGGQPSPGWAALYWEFQQGYPVKPIL